VRPARRPLTAGWQAGLKLEHGLLHFEEALFIGSLPGKNYFRIQFQLK